MAKSKVNQPVGIISINNNPLALDYKKKYEDWFRGFQRLPCYNNVKGKLFQREFLIKQSIPYLELCSSFHDRTQTEHQLILFVSCNPSGRDEDYYAANNSSQDVFCYYNRADSIYNQVDDFIRVLGMTGVEFAMADVFPIVRSAQDDLKDAWKKYKVDLLPLTKLFKAVVCEIQPTVIVAINAFVSGLFKDGFLSDNSSQPLTLVNDSYYDLSYNTSFSTVAFCGGMLTGQHAMDIHSRMRLIRDVRDYLISH